MFSNRSLNTKIDQLHQRCLRINYNDNNSNLKYLLERDDSISIHHQDLETLIVEKFSASGGLSSEIPEKISVSGPFVSFSF